MFTKVRKYLSKDRGSASIILSLLVSTSVLSTIYITQKMTGGFLSDLSQSMEEWEKHLVTESAQTLAAYLVSNNLVLCREGGWTGKNSNCKWTTVSGVDSPSAFYLSNESDTADGLSYKGTYEVDDNNREYKVTFQLVDWRTTSIENLIGDIPEAVCRDKNTLKIISNATCVDRKDSSDPVNQTCERNGNPVTNSVCEYLKPMDGDHWIVLMKVEVDYKDPISDADLKHIALSGIRRPLSSIKFGTVISGRKCSLGCKGGSTYNPFVTCRSQVIPSEVGSYTGKASNIVSVKNEGPGTIYSLSLMRTAVQLTGADTYTIDVTPDIVAQVNKEMWSPGETIKFEYFYDCPIEVRRTKVYKVGDQDRIETKSNTRDVPYEKFLYGLNLNVDNPTGVCYASGGSAPPSATASDVDFTLTNGHKLASASCTLGNSSCSHGGVTGSCKFVGIEPRRVFAVPSPVVATRNALIKEVVTTIYSSPPPPSSYMASDGDGSDGVDGTGDMGGDDHGCSSDDY